MNKFKLSCNVMISDEYFLDLVNYGDENHYKNIEDIPTEVMISVIKDYKSICHEIDWLNTEDVIFEKKN